MQKLEEYSEALIQSCKNVISSPGTKCSSPYINSADFFDFCYHHKLENIVYEASDKERLESNNITVLFQDKYEQAILNDASQQYYLDMITNAFAENGIDYLVLKGMMIKKLYPSSDLRQCSDIDIYIGPQNADKARIIMEGLGFSCLSFNGFGTDNYQLDKFSFVELHRQLISDDYRWREECNKIPSRLINRGNHEYVMTNEDFYIFMVCHIAKHMKWGGIGIRAILDVWVYLSLYQNLDWDFIKEVFEKCELTKFHSRLIALVDYWFNEKSADEVTQRLANYVAFSGWNGIDLQYQSSLINKNAGATGSKAYARLRWYFEVAFINRQVMEMNYPVLKKYPALLPFCWIHRGVRAIFRRHDTIRNVLNAYEDVDMAQAQKINLFREEIGL